MNLNSSASLQGDETAEADIQSPMPSTPFTPGSSILRLPVPPPPFPIMIKPKRGGKHPLYGIYMGGSTLDYLYQPVKASTYKTTSQLRSIKATPVLESTLHSIRSASTSIQFNGNLEIASGSTVNELDQREFLLSTKEMVQRYGFHSFFSMPLGTKEMLPLAENSHKFTVDEVISEYEDRVQPEATPFLDPLSNLETESSIVIRYKSYDEFERGDLALSRLAMESLVAPAFRTIVHTRFSHLPDFDDFPGQVYFMMVLDVANTSVAYDIEAAETSFRSLQLSSYPGENISSLTTEALRLVKIMQTGYSLRVSLGSELLEKVTKTESEFFNRKVFGHLETTLTMEDEHGRLRDPKLLEMHDDYPIFGPVGVCAFLQKEYGTLVKRHAWPALVPKVPIPQGNYTPGGDNRLKKPSNQLKCYRCNSDTHLVRDCKEPDPNVGQDNSNGNSNVGKPGWRYLHPSDVNHKLTHDGKEWFFCSKCLCRHTGKTGFYNRTHSTSQHKTSTRPVSIEAPSSGISSSNSSVPSAASTTPSDASTLTNSTSGTAPGASYSPVPDDCVDTDPNGLHFDGAFLAEDLFDDGAWVASTDIKEEEETAISAAIGVSVLNLSDDDVDADPGYTPSPFLVPSTTSPSLPLTVPDAYKVTNDDIIDIRNHAIPFSYSFTPDKGYMVIFPTKEESLKYSAFEVRSMLPNSGKQTITIGFEINSSDSVESDMINIDNTSKVVPTNTVNDTEDDDELFEDAISDELESTKSNKSTLLYSDFYDCYETNLISTDITNFLHDTCIRFIPYILTYFHLIKCAVLLGTTSLQSLICYPLMLTSIFFWDTVMLFKNKPPQIPRKWRRRKLGIPTIRQFSSSWLILSAYMLSTGSASLHPG